MIFTRDVQAQYKAAKLGLPDYQPKYFSTVEEFEDYIKSPDYKSNRKTRGICFGV